MLSADVYGHSTQLRTFVIAMILHVRIFAWVNLGRLDRDPRNPLLEGVSRNKWTPLSSYANERDAVHPI